MNPQEHSDIYYPAIVIKPDDMLKRILAAVPCDHCGGTEIEHAWWTPSSHGFIMPDWLSEVLMQ